MRAAVVGGGPVGCLMALGLARRGHEVTLVDRDPGPFDGGPWVRRGVMQFHLPHFFRHLTRLALLDTAPEVWEGLVAAGGVPARPPGAPDQVTGLACRRSTFERVLRSQARSEPGVTWSIGHADDVVAEHGRAVGVLVDGTSLDADVVVVATGRAGRLADRMRPPGEGGGCGFSYVARQYQAHRLDDALVGLPQAALYSDYLAIIFPQDAGTHSVLIVRPTADTNLAALRTNEQFDVVAALVPHLAPWVDPVRFDPISDVMVGGGLTNTYRRQLDENGQAVLPGLLFVGDVVSTTNPAAGRGVSLGLQQAITMVAMLDEGLRPGADLSDVAERFEAWSEANIRPWYEDHVYWDATLLGRMSGHDLDLDAPIPSDVVCAAAEIDEQIAPAAMAYQGMQALPYVLDPMQERARAVLRTGWRPAVASGPSSQALGEVLQSAS